MKSFKTIIKKFGPGFVTGAADDDPSGIAAYSQTGARYGYSQLWVVVLLTPFMVVVQEMCGRIGMVTGSGLAAVIKRRFGRAVLVGAVVLLLVANVLNIGADLGAMASSMQMVSGGSFSIWLIAIAALIIALEVFVPYKIYSRYLKYFALSLVAYFVAAFVVRQDWVLVLKSVVLPNIIFTRDYFFNLIAILGTTISPYLFFWQASEENEEEVASGKIKDIGGKKPRVSSNDLREMRQDTTSGMIFSNLIAFFIIATAAATLGRGGITEVNTAADAAMALKPLAGSLAAALFTVGIIGTGLLAVPVLAGSASYALSEAVGWPIGLYRKYFAAKGFYAIIAIATFSGAVINFSGIAPFKMLYYAAAVNGIIAPFLLVLIMIISADRRIMGKYVNTPIKKVFGWGIAGIMFVCSIALLF
jgi:NRAMP (natural resistance-associated macrophage protein)-like metal ion transporter